MAVSRVSSGNGSVVTTRSSLLNTVNTRGSSAALGQSAPPRMMEDILGGTSTAAFGNLLSPMDRPEAQYQDLADMAAEVDRIQKVGAAMNGPYRAPAWSVLKSGPHALIEQGQAVGDEAEELRSQQLLYKIMDREGLFSPMRQHVTKNIRQRTGEDAELFLNADARSFKDRLAELTAAENVEIRHVEISVRKQLGTLANSRKDLASVKKKLEFNELSLESPHANQSLGALRAI